MSPGRSAPDIGDLGGSMGLSRFSPILVVGAPGSGKGTQAGVISDACQIPHVATGDLLRDHVRRGTALGSAASTYMASGDLVPDEIVIKILIERFQKPDAERGVLLDGFPRTLSQAHLLDRQLASHGGGVWAVFYLVVPEASLIQRLTGRRVCVGCQGTFHVQLQALPPGDVCPTCGDHLVQRPDDHEEIIRHRVAVYLQETQPVLKYYAEQNLIYPIDGDRPVDEIRVDLLNVLRRLEPSLATS
jgi:adenylate kinase